MRIYGEYNDIDNNIISVVFERDIAGADIEISEESTLQFTWDGVSISENIDNLFDETITTSASIELLTEDYFGDFFFSKSPTDVTCVITKTYVYDNDESTVTLFDGYVSPDSYGQPYYKPHDKFTVSCVDKLSILQYYYYRNISTLSRYNDRLQSAGIVSFKYLLDDALGEGNWDYDNSKQINFNNLNISESVILGESYDDVWTKEKVLEQVCKYLGLHVKQVGSRFRLFSWQTIKNAESTYNVYGCDENGLGNIRESDMNITIDDVYNSVSVKDNVTPIEEIVSSPLTSDSLYSPYSSSQHWMTEYISDGNGEAAWEAIQKLTGTVDGDTEYDGAHRKEWYFQLKQSQFWDLYDKTGNNINQQMKTGINQTDLLEEMRRTKYMPLFISVGNNSSDGKDADGPSSLKKPSLTDYLVISVNGDLSNKKADDENDPESLDRLPADGIMRYNGFSAANLTPADDISTNYIIIGGKITLAPIVTQTGSGYYTTNVFSYDENGDNATTVGVSMRRDNETYNQMDKPTYEWSESLKSWTVPSDNTPDGRYYYTRFYKQTYPSTLINNTQLHIPADNSLMLYPICDVKKIIEQNPYSASAKAVADSKYNAGAVFVYNRTTTERDKTGEDKISKLPILACKMSVGDGDNVKYLVETYDDETGHCTYSWSDTEGFFTIGIDPNLGDRIIGQEFSIQDNTGEYGIDATGMAIPITKDVPVSGRVEFSILGPVNTVWNEGYIRIHSTLWRHSGYVKTGTLNLLSYISNIWISDFSVKIYTDNGYADNTGDSDIIYISDEANTNQDYVAGKYETEFDFITQLTTQECVDMDVKNTINVNSVLGADKTPINTILDENTHEPWKPEEHYVKEYYEYYKQPKMIVNVTIKDDEELDRYFIEDNKRVYVDYVYSVSSLPGRTFILMNKERDLKYNTTKIYLREV